MKKHLRPEPPAPMMFDRFHPDNTIPKAPFLWVFGSNLAGRHGAGAAKVAHCTFKAEYGVGKGLTGHSYAIATKGKNLEVLPLSVIEDQVKEFLEYAKANPKSYFFVTRIGCGLAGYEDKEIAPMFISASDNISFPAEWKSVLFESIMNKNKVIVKPSSPSM